MESVKTLGERKQAPVAQKKEMVNENYSDVIGWGEKHIKMIERRRIERNEENLLNGC